MSDNTEYVYGFEVEDILKQFFALIDKSIVMRYEKVENERRLVQTITPTYKFATKNRALLLSLNSAKNFALPCVVVEVTGISADKDRLAAKGALISRYNNNLLEGYKRPTPITISVTLNIITKYKSDLFQIYGKLATQFQPECFISWMVPTNYGIKGVEELRNKVEWDFNLDIDSKETLKEEDEDRFTGKMTFKIQGWMFPNHKSYRQTILDIGTTSLVTNELENRLDGLIDEAAPLTSLYGSLYKNPRQFATAHPRILKGFVTVNRGDKSYYFRIQKDSYDNFKLNGSMPDYENSGKLKDREYLITFDGYNFTDVQAFFVPKNKCSVKQETFSYNTQNAKVNPKLEESKTKPKTIKGIPLTIISKSENILVVKLPKINYKGDFDIILYDTIDYDSFSDAEGFLLHATN